MKKLWIQGLFVSIFAIPMFAVDSEMEYFQHSSRESDWNMLGYRYHSFKNESDPMKYFRNFAQMYPGTHEAYIADERVIGYLFVNGPDEAFLKQAEKMMHRSLEDGRDTALGFLVRFANDKKHPEELRKRAADMALAHCEGYGNAFHALWTNFLRNNITWDQGLAFAQKAGKDEPDAMGTLFQLLDDTPEKRDAFEALYGKNFLPPVKKVLQKETSECNYLVQDARDYIEDKDYDSALKCLLEMKKYSVWSSRNALMNFLGSIRIMPDDQVRRFTEAVFEFALPGEIFQSWMNVAVLERKSSFESENLAATTRILRLYGLRGVSKSKLMFTLSFMRSRGYDDYPLIAEIALARGLSGEYAGRLLFSAAINVWDTDLGKADFYLDETMRIAPGTSAAAKARWWKERKEGKVSFNAGAAPREPEYLTDNPELSVSEGATAKPDAAGTSLLPEEWVPASLPEAKDIALDSPKTISGADVEMTPGVNFILELKDKDGRILRVVERAWPFPILINRHLYQPAGSQSIRFLPVDDVSFVRITVLRRNSPKDGIRSMKLRTPPYPLRRIQREKELDIPAGMTCFETTLTATEPEKKITLGSGCENWRVTAYSRWYDPWTSHNRFGNTNVFFFGCKQADIDASRGGVLRFFLDGKPGEMVKKSDGMETLQVNAGPGFHCLNTFTTALPELLQDTHTPDGAWLRKVTVSGKALAIPGAEFLVKGKWTPFVAGSRLKIPAKAKKVRPCILFDSSAVHGELTASVTNHSTSFSKNKGAAGTDLGSLYASAPADATEEAAKFLHEKRPAVVYSKGGTKMEYEAAKALAERAGCYLVSDDAALNNEGYRGPFLVLGSPLNNRFLRQAAAHLGLFFSPEYLNNKDGMIFQVPEVGKEEMFYAVSGMTPDAVVKATDRLKSKTGKLRKKNSFRLFEQPLMTRLMPWQLHPEKTELAELSLTMAGNERRNAAFGLVLEKDASKADVKVSIPVNSAGKLPPVQVRFVGFHEYINFYGDLHQPDLLFNTMRMPEKAYTSHLVLLTCKVPRNTTPGTYESMVTVAIDGKEKTVPFRINVVNGTIPDSDLQFNDYASMPYFYHETARMHRDRRNLIRNQAEHGISMQRISFPLRFKADGKADFTLLEEYVKETDAIYREEGKPVPYYTFGLPDYRLRMLAARDKKQYEDYAKAYAKDLRAYLDKHPDLDKRLYCSLGDEILGILDRWLKEAKIYKDAGLKIYVTHADPRMADVVAAWCPNYAHKLFDQPYLAKALKEGKQRVWWYICAGGGPNTRFTGDPVDAYPVYLLTVKWGVQGASNNAALYFPPGSNPVPYRFDHGSDTRVFFLPSGEICDTLRREFEAEGIQDAFLLYPLRNNPKIQALLKKVVPSKWQYSRDPADYDALRDKAHSLMK